MRSWLAFVLGVVAASAGTTVAFADDNPAWVRAELAGTSTRIVAHFEYDVTDGMHQGLSELDTPNNGVVTGAVISADGVTRRLALVPSQVATTELEQFLHGDAGDDQPWLVRIASSGHAATLDIGAASSALVALDLEIESATCFFHDARYVALPDGWAGRVDPAIIADPHGDDFQAACGDAAVWIAFPDRELARHAPGADRIGVHTARLPLSSHDLATVEIAIAGQLGEVPADLYTALVVDGSRSLTPNRARAQRAIVAAYLRAAPRGRVQLISYARDARALLADWSDATIAAPAIDRAIAELTARNGSNLDTGLAEAASWLARVHGTRRIVVLTDELVPQRLEALDQTVLARSLPDHTLVHVVQLADDDTPSTTREDDALFAPLAAATFGMAVRGAANDKLEADATMLARPIALDHLDVSGGGWSLRDVSCSSGSVAEGTSCTWTGGGDPESGRVTVAGEIWGRHFERIVELDRGEARTLARALSAAHGFEHDEQAEIDRAAEAVNDEWSLLARWGGGDSYGEQGRRFSTSCSTTGTSSHCGGGVVVRAEPLLDLRDQIAPAVATCGAPHAHVALDLELTLNEIVDVHATVSGDGATPALHDCIVEAAWQVMLELPRPPVHRVVRVELR